eukprot:499794_1
MSDARDGSFKWCFNDAHFLSTHVFNTQLKPKHKISSATFYIGGFEWQLNVFPKGNDESTSENFNVYLQLITDIEQRNETITINYRLFQTETMTSFTTITTFKSPYDHGWNNNTLKTKQLHKFDSITIQCYINILQIRINNDITYQSSNIMQQSLSSNQFPIQWKPNNKLLQYMNNAEIGQSFESTIKHTMFCFRFYPNGIDSYSQGQSILALQLCSLPQNISKLEMKVKLLCKETNTEYICTYRNNDNIMFSYENVICNWPQIFNKDQTILPLSPQLIRGQSSIDNIYDTDSNSTPTPKSYNTKTFSSLNFNQFKQQQSITFVAELQMLKYYDLNDITYEYKKIKPPLELKKTETMPAEIRWKLDIDTIMHMKPGEWIDSEYSHIWRFKWFLRLFPKGNGRYKSGHAALFLCVQELQFKTTLVILNYRLFCHETCTSYTNIGTFDKHNWLNGFNSNTCNMRINFDTFVSNIINIGCYFNIIKTI